ncbi:hypothetical protein Clacol_008167 [Clathrus columnatus]|uniref:DUF2421 domain-containing protein n=1 Tax=Clathrus columnatus TaxID=1419009 RepID=A0AAV5AM20_9AGAM|nr:hypothetical protein Clacol_008167 [Clathrus columnatus]
MGLLLLGGSIGWAWGCAAMKAALTARSKVLLLSQIEKVNRTTSSSANPDAAFQIEIFRGEFLDVGSSVVFGVFLAVGAFCFAVVRGTSPRLASFSIIGSIFLNIMCSFGPLFPAANYTLAQSFITSLAASMAISSVTIILVFPETLNYVALKGIIGLLTTIKRLLEIQEKVLKTKTSDELREGSLLGSQIQGMLGGVFAGMEKCEDSEFLVLFLTIRLTSFSCSLVVSSNAKMLSLEFSYGRFKGEDLRSLNEPLIVLVARISGLQNLSRLAVGEHESTMQRPPRSKDKDKDDKWDERISSPNPLAETPSDPDSFILRHMKSLKDDTVHQEEIFPLVYAATADLRQSCISSLSAIINTLELVNNYRWSKAPSSDPDLNIKINELQACAEEFKAVRRLSVLEPFNRFVVPSHSLSNETSRKMLFIAFTYEANLIWLVDSVLELLDIISELASRHPSSRLWAPKGLRSLWKIIIMDKGDIDVSEDNDYHIDPVIVERQNLKCRHDPDSEPPENMFQRIGDVVYKSYNWCTTPRAIFAFKYAFITVALWLPSVFKNSALTNYSNRGIWAILTAQTTLEPFIADQIFSFIARFAATTAGVVTGLVGWYIGSGNGPGNPYGIAIVMAVLLIPIMFWRLFTSSLIPAIMYGVTVLLRTSLRHLILVVNTGVGWPLAWRRWLLVVIGLGASAVVLFIPPKSARTAVRYANASIIFELSRLYGLLISEWIIAEEHEQHHEKMSDESQYGKWPAKFRRDFTKVGAKIQLLKLRTNVARWEGSFRGRWPAKEYKRLNTVESEMLSYLAQLAGAVYHLDSIADVMSVFSLVSRSLRTGEPVQETLPKNLLDRVLYHHSRRHQEGPNIDAEEQWEHIHSVDFLAYATGVTAVYKILTLLDELHFIIIKLCGEVPLRGFAEWKTMHELRNLQ